LIGIICLVLEEAVCISDKLYSTEMGVEGANLKIL